MGKHSGAGSLLTGGRHRARMGPAAAHAGRLHAPARPGAAAGAPVPELLHRLFEERCATLRAQGRSRQIAVETADRSLSYEELDAWSNRLARHLLARGLHPGGRVALLVDDAAFSYAAMLAVLKAGAAYVSPGRRIPPRADRLHPLGCGSGHGPDALVVAGPARPAAGRPRPLP
ncbi:AMP-binding protein [Pseudarthrobacter sp. P1]|uniref:AMP-binding protein n=1 Tax=Pseudarthrobacter sp. P1 TaxID=3418418 RepID=UPI003CFA1DDE